MSSSRRHILLLLWKTLMYLQKDTTCFYPIFGKPFCFFYTNSWARYQEFNQFKLNACYDDAVYLNDSLKMLIWTCVYQCLFRNLYLNTCLTFFIWKRAFFRDTVSILRILFWIENNTIYTVCIDNVCHCHFKTFLRFRFWHDLYN